MSRERGLRTKGATPAITAALEAGIEHEVLEYAHEPGAEGYGEKAARALGLDPASVFKTLMARAEGAGLAVAVVPVGLRLDLKALAGALGAKRAAMAHAAEAQRATGYVVGGISPLGQKRALPTVIDASAEGLERIHVSAGQRGLELALAPTDLARLTRARFAPIAR